MSKKLCENLVTKTHKVSDRQMGIKTEIERKKMENERRREKREREICYLEPAGEQGEFATWSLQENKENLLPGACRKTRKIC